MRTEDELHAAMVVQSGCRRAGIEIGVDLAIWLARERFSADWIPILIARADAMPKVRDPESMVGRWITGGGWRDQMLYAIATRSGLWSELADGARFNLCRKLRSTGLRPWHVAAILNAAKKLDGIRHPLAFAAKLIRDRAWIQFTERIDREQSMRQVTAPAVVSIVQHVLRGQRERLFAEAWAAGTNEGVTTDA